LLPLVCSSQMMEANEGAEADRRAQADGNQKPKRRIEMKKAEIIAKLNEMGISHEEIRGGKLLIAPADPDQLKGESDPRYAALAAIEGAEMTPRIAKWFFPPEWQPGETIPLEVMEKLQAN